MNPCHSCKLQFIRNTRRGLEQRCFHSRFFGWGWEMAFKTFLFLDFVILLLESGKNFCELFVLAWGCFRYWRVVKLSIFLNSILHFCLILAPGKQNLFKNTHLKNSSLFFLTDRPPGSHWNSLVYTYKLISMDIN